MSIKNVESTLPDPAWVKAVEDEISRLSGLIERLRLDLVEARQ